GDERLSGRQLRLERALWMTADHLRLRGQTMMRAKTGWVWTTALLVVGATMLTAERTAAAEVDTPLQSAKLPKSVGAVVAASNKFGAALVGRLVKPSAGRTVVLSPYGVGTALSMLALGAEGGTRTVLHNGLGHAHLTAEQVIEAYTDLHRELATASND